MTKQDVVTCNSSAVTLVLFCCCCLSQREMATPVEISLEDIASHCEVETSCLDEAVTSAYYHEVSQYLSKWKLIAPKLKFTDNEIESIDQDNLTAEMKKVSFLKEWKQKFAMKATYRALMESLLGIKRVEDATGVCQVLKDSQNVKGTQGFGECHSREYRETHSSHFACIHVCHTTGFEETTLL